MGFTKKMNVKKPAHSRIRRFKTTFSEPGEHSLNGEIIVLSFALCQIVVSIICTLHYLACCLAGQQRLGRFPALRGQAFVPCIEPPNCRRLAPLRASILNVLNGGCDESATPCRMASPKSRTAAPCTGRLAFASEHFHCTKLNRGVGCFQSMWPAMKRAVTSFAPSLGA